MGMDNGGCAFPYSGTGVKAEGPCVWTQQSVVGGALMLPQVDFSATEAKRINLGEVVRYQHLTVSMHPIERLQLRHENT